MDKDSIIQQLAKHFFAQHTCGVLCNVNLEEFTAYNTEPRREYIDNDDYCTWTCECSENCHLMAKEDIEACDIYQTEVPYDEEYPEPYEFWVIDNDAFIMLKTRGELVYKNDETNLKLWGRQCTGQAVYLDDVWQEMAVTYSSGMKVDAKHILLLIDMLK